MIRQYALNMAMAVDQFVSTVLGGHPDDTVSQRLGRVLVSGGGHWSARWAARVIDWFAWMLVGERDHCVNSLHGKTMAIELWNWGGSRDQINVEDVKQ